MKSEASLTQTNIYKQKIFQETELGWYQDIKFSKSGFDEIC